jgi:hypothetical protein
MLTRRLVELAADWEGFHLAQDEYKARAVVQKARGLAGVMAEADAREKAERERAADERAERDRRTREEALRISGSRALPAFLVDYAALMIPPSTASAAPPRLSGMFGVPDLYEGELFRGREHPPDIREMLGARN